MNDFVVLERADEVGGTWQANTYPGCACDVPSHLYSFSFAPNPEWTQTYSPQPEIWAYLRRCADEFGIRPHLRLDSAVESATWLGGRAPVGARDLAGHAPRARARRRHGAADRAADPRHPRPRATSRARLPLGPLEPRRRPRPASGSPRSAPAPRRSSTCPEIQPRGRAAARVPAHAAVGAAALQPADQPSASGACTGALPVAPAARARRHLRRPRGARARLREEPAADEGRRADRAQAHASSQIADPELREKVTPDYTIGCKRILPSNRWYRALGKPNVELVTDGVQRGARALDRRRRRRRARGRRDRLRHRLPRHRHPGRPPHPRPRRRAARRPLARQPARPPRHDGRRASRTCSSCSARTPGSGTARWST